jgi:hypothetical protein
MFVPLGEVRRRVRLPTKSCRISRPTTSRSEIVFAPDTTRVEVRTPGVGSGLGTSALQYVATLQMGVGVTVAGVPVGVAVIVRVELGMTVGVSVRVGVLTGVKVRVAVRVAIGIEGVWVGVAVAVAVPVGSGVGVAVPGLPVTVKNIAEWMPHLSSWFLPCTKRECRPFDSPLVSTRLDTVTEMPPKLPLIGSPLPSVPGASMV